MVTEVRELQYLKAYSPIVVILLPMGTEVRELQPLNAFFPIVVTLLGMVTEVRELQPLKAYSPIVVTPSPIIILVQPEYPHGPLDEKSCISPFPVMVNTPPLVSSHFRLAPQVPDLSA